MYDIFPFDLPESKPRRKSGQAEEADISDMARRPQNEKRMQPRENEEAYGDLLEQGLTCRKKLW